MDDETKQPIKKLKMKKNWRVNFTSPTGFSLTEIYCRHCVQYKNPKEFQISYDTVLDKSGMMSVCKSCCGEIYQDYLRSERDIRKAMIKVCRTLNWIYSDTAIDGTIEKIKQFSESNPDSKALFTTTYWGMIQSISKFGERSGLGNILTFTEPIISDFIPKEMIDEAITQDTIDFWGDGYNEQDYRFMEIEFGNFKRTHKIETHSEVVLCKEVVYEMLKNKKTRLSGGDVDAKRLESLMKSLAISPNMTNASQSSKAMDTFSAFIKTIEETTPAEYYKDKMLFKDFDGMEWYFDRFVRRPIKNFFGLSRDFNISDEAGEYEEFESDEDGRMVEDLLSKTKEDSENI